MHIVKCLLPSLMQNFLFFFLGPFNISWYFLLLPFLLFFRLQYFVLIFYTWTHTCCDLACFFFLSSSFLLLSLFPFPTVCQVFFSFLYFCLSHHSTFSIKFVFFFPFASLVFHSANVRHVQYTCLVNTMFENSKITTMVLNSANNNSNNNNEWMVKKE